MAPLPAYECPVYQDATPPPFRFLRGAVGGSLHAGLIWFFAWNHWLHPLHDMILPAPGGPWILFISSIGLAWVTNVFGSPETELPRVRTASFVLLYPGVVMTVFAFFPMLALSFLAPVVMLCGIPYMTAIALLVGNLYLPLTAPIAIVCVIVVRSIFDRRPDDHSNARRRTQKTPADVNIHEGFDFDKE